MTRPKTLLMMTMCAVSGRLNLFRREEVNGLVKYNIN